jgi:hypothetical protein
MDFAVLPRQHVGVVEIVLEQRGMFVVSVKQIVLRALHDVIR